MDKKSFAFLVLSELFLLLGLVIYFYDYNAVLFYLTSFVLGVLCCYRHDQLYREEKKLSSEKEVGLKNA